MHLADITPLILTREEMARNGRALVASRFTWPGVARQMEEAYLACRARR